MQRKIITLFGNKGGIGKSTLANFLAYRFHIMGFRTLLVDAHKEDSCCGCARMHKSAKEFGLPVPELVLFDKLNKGCLGLKRMLSDEKILGEEYEIIIVDTAAHNNTSTWIAERSDLLICPTTDSREDQYYLAGIKEFLIHSEAEHLVVFGQHYPMETGLKYGYFLDRQEAIIASEQLLESKRKIQFDLELT